MVAARLVGGAEARLRHRRQQAGAERRLGRGAAAGSSWASSRAWASTSGLTGFGELELEQLLAGDRWRGRSGRGARAAGRAGQPARRSLDLRRASGAVRRRDGLGRRREAPGRRAGRHDVHRSALQRELRQLGQGQAARQEPADPERRPGREFRRASSSASANILAVTKGAIYICMSSSELDTLQKAFREAGGKWSTFVIWAKNTFTLGRADYQRQYEPILYGWKDGTDHFWCGARDQGDVWFFDKPAKNDLHPTMKPVALVERAIRNSSKSRDIVLDPFGGSGTTLIAAEQYGPARAAGRTRSALRRCDRPALAAGQWRRRPMPRPGLSSRLPKPALG